MNLAMVDKIAKAVLYEGYMLYPYRPSSVKKPGRSTAFSRSGGPGSRTFGLSLEAGVC